MRADRSRILLRSVRATNARFVVIAGLDPAIQAAPRMGGEFDQERTIASAIAAGINYFDTAVLYGNGESEKNLGRVLRNLKASDVVVGTKSGCRAPNLDVLPVPSRRRWKEA